MTTDLTTQIIIIVMSLLIALGVGLFLRYLLVRRLKKTVLDNWLVQIFGFLIIIPPVIAGIIVASFLIGIKATEMLLYLQLVLPNIFNINNLGNLIWNLALSVLIILLAIGVGRTLMKLLNRGAAKEHIGINISTLLGRILFILVLSIAFLLILTIWNVQFGIPAAVISVITVGFTFVLQDLLKNVVAGIYILLEGPFHIGEKITTENYTGIVEAVQLRATKLRIGNGEQVIVPNAILFSNIVVNKTFYKESRATITITMLQEDFEKDETAACILKAIKEVNGVMLKPEPELRLIATAGSFGETTGTTSGYTGRIVTLALHFWFPEGQDSIIIDAMFALRTALPHADLTLSEGL